MGNAIGPDVSFYQDEPTTPEQIDFVKMKKSADFVIIRAGQNLWPDSDFKYNWAEAKKARLPRGSYWFYDSRADPKRQAELWVDLLAGDLGELPLFADFEDAYGGQYAGWRKWYDFLERLKELVGQKEIAIYTAFYYWRDNAPSATPGQAWNTSTNIRCGLPTTVQRNLASQSPGAQTNGCSGNSQKSETANSTGWKAKAST